MSPKGSERVSVCISFSEGCCSPNSQCNDINHLRFEIQSSFNRSMCRVVLKDISNISGSFDRLSEVLSERCPQAAVMCIGVAGRGGTREAGAALGWDFSPARVNRQPSLSLLCIHQEL